MKKCPFCTAPVPALACKCPHCGEWVETAFPDPAADPRTAGEAGTQWFVGVFLGLALLGVLVGLGLFFGTALPYLGRLQKDREQIEQQLKGTERPPARAVVPPTPPQAPAG
jgi:hypothetical protein